MYMYVSTVNQGASEQILESFRIDDGQTLGR